MLSGQIIDDFTRDGAVVLRGVLKQGCNTGCPDPNGRSSLVQGG